MRNEAKKLNGSVDSLAKSLPNVAQKAREESATPLKGDVDALPEQVSSETTINNVNENTQTQFAQAHSRLDEIFSYKKDEVAEEKSELSLEDLQNKLQDEIKHLPPTRDFLAALQAKTPSLICEIKKESPSKGLMRDDFANSGSFDVPAFAKSYEKGGAACLSVLTDSIFFGGSEKDLQLAKASCSLPVLRKDFMIDVYQIYESKLLGADAILIILAMVDDETALALYETATKLQLTSLVEVRDKEELDRAIKLGAKLIGINNRNLHNFQTDIALSETLAPSVPNDIQLVAESGITSKQDIKHLSSFNINSFLIGEHFMRQNNLEKAVKNILS